MMSSSLSLLTILFSINQGVGVRVVVMQPEGHPNGDAAILHLARLNLTIQPGQGVVEGWSGWEGVPYTYSLTLCLWCFTTYFRPKPAVVSYAVSSQYVNEMYADISSTLVGFAFYSSFFSGGVSMLQDEWRHLCLWYHHDLRLRRLYLDGRVLVEEPFLSPRPLFLNGTLVVGQEQDDEPGGGFDWYQSFGGKVGVVQMWPRPLSSTQIAHIASCNPASEKDLIDWDAGPWQLLGEAQWEEVALKEFCEAPPPPTLVFPERRTVPATRELCSVVNGQVSLPMDAAENISLSTLVQQHAGKCGPRVGVWLGVSEESEEGVWKSWSTDSPITYKPFTSRQPDGERNENCLLLDLSRDGWSDWSCSVANQFCVSCTFTEPQVYALRGLCEPNPLDTVFTLRGYLGGRPYWRGLLKYRVEYVEPRWELRDLWKNTTLATLTPRSAATYPHGLHTWTVLVEKSICSASEGDEWSLALTRCRGDQFTCNDGSCVRQSQRCDLRNQCEDGSDEDGCHNVLTPPGYRANLPPAPVLVTHTSTPVTLLVQLERLSKIDTLNMEVWLDYTLELSWRDPRLTYSNLKAHPKVNIVQVRDGKDVWVPHVQYPSANGVMRLRQQTFTMRRLGDPEPDDLSRPLQDKVFHGTNASLVYTWKCHMAFTCNMQLLYYPFDIQVCVIPVVMASASVEYLTFITPVAEYLGERALTEVEIGEVSVVIQNTTDDNRSSGVVRLELRRRYAFFITSTYLPTMMLLLVGYGTLYIRMSMLQVRSIMSLTTLLVLTSLYTQTAASLPKTSYLKAIDVWLLFCIITLVLLIVTHISTDFMAIQHENSQNQNKAEVAPVLVQPPAAAWKERAGKAPTAGGGGGGGVNSVPRLMQLMRVLVPLGFLVFNMFYWLFVTALI